MTKSRQSQTRVIKKKGLVVIVTGPGGGFSSKLTPRLVANLPESNTTSSTRSFRLIWATGSSTLWANLFIFLIIPLARNICFLTAPAKLSSRSGLTGFPSLAMWAKSSSSPAFSLIMASAFLISCEMDAVIFPKNSSPVSPIMSHPQLIAYPLTPWEPLSSSP